MRRALKIVLVIVALLGLFGQTVAVAASPHTTHVESVMPMDCLGMMQSGSDKSPPCDRITLGCIAGIGCALPLTLAVGQPLLVQAKVEGAAPAWRLTPALIGRSLQPEPHPPSTLA
jgi:hypothetical protein